MQIKKDLFMTLTISISVMFTTLIGLFFVGYHNAAASFWPAAGFYVAFYYIYRKKALPGIIISLLITNIVFRYNVTNEPILNTFIISTIFVIGNVVEMFVFTFVIEKVKCNLRKLDVLKNGLGFSLAVFLSALLGSIISVIAIAIYFGFEDIFVIQFRWMIGNFTGMLIFASLIFYSHYRDGLLKNSFGNLTSSSIFLSVFVIISFFVFEESGNNFITFENFQISFFILYVVAAFVFSYRMIATINLIFLLAVAILFIPGIEPEHITNQTVLLSIYLMALSSIASLIKNVLYERNKNYENALHASDNLEQIILSTNELLQVENRLPEDEKEFSVRYLRNMFDIACKIYPKFDKATCNIKEEKYVKFVAGVGYDLEVLNELKFLSDEFVWTLSSPEIVRTTDYDVVFEDIKNKDEFIEEFGVLKESIRFTVIIGENQYAGMSFDLFSNNPESFTKNDLEGFISFQHLMNSYYRIGNLITQNNNLKDDIVLSLVRTLELYDLYTGGHSEEVAYLSVDIAKKLKLSEDSIREIYWAGIVHDIGKIGLSNEILNKPTRLTDEEFEMVKQHSVFGYNILSRSEGLMSIATIVRHHHEWWSGNGYPDGLRGIDIPYSSQILHVCDAVSAMAKDRVYQKALNEQEIIDQLQSGLGKQFSPKVAKTMIKYIEDGDLRKFLKKYKKKKV